MVHKRAILSSESRSDEKCDGYGKWTIYMNYAVRYVTLPEGKSLIVTMGLTQHSTLTLNLQHIASW